MKLYAILIICSAIFYVDAQHCSGDRLTIIIAKCLGETNATAVDVEDIILQKKSSSENGKCFRSCIVQKCKLMDAFGNIDPLAHKDYLQLLSGGDVEKYSLIDKLYIKCSKTPKVEGKLCSTAENYVTCFFDNCHNCGWDVRSLL